jgi:DNA (cytosine-5)-methyltransferase 1
MNAISLFANVGIGEIYLKDIGVNVVVANELEEKRCKLYKELHPQVKVICGDIKNNNVKTQIYQACPDAIRGGIDLIIATPPCQGMSVANAKKSPKDPRNLLILHAMEVFNDLLPDYMLIENVPGMAKTFININGKIVNIIDFINSKLPEGYKMNYKVIDAKNYGTAQSRKRFIGLISKKGKWVHPDPSDKLKTVRDAIGHLESMESGMKSNLPWHYAKKHNENHIIWMRNTPTGKTAFDNKVHYPQKDGRRIKGFMTTYKRIEWDKPAPTVTMCNGAISSQNNVHPGKKLNDGTYSDARVMSVREIMLICGIPEDFFDSLIGKYSENFIRLVLGECFLPLMCLEIIKNIKKI